MFGRNVQNESTQLDLIIIKVLDEMIEYGPHQPEYPMLLEQLQKLTALKTTERRDRVSPDTVALVAGNLLGILVIVSYERTHVMMSKGLGLILKSKTV